MAIPLSIASVRTVALAVCTAGTLLFASQVQSAGQAGASDAQAAYKRDRAACMRGETNQERATCLREAGAARQEAARGGLAGGEQAQFEANRLRRCDNQPSQDREDCIRRMHGEGATSGSVESGGIYRELVTPVVPKKGN